MHLGAGQGGCVVQRLGHAGAKFRLARRQARQTALACVPITRRGVEEHLGKAMVLQSLGDLGSLKGIGE